MSTTKNTVKGVSLKHQVEDGNIRVRIPGRLSFPALFEPDDFNGKSDPKYKATVLIEDIDVIDDLRTLVEEVIALSPALKGKKLGADKRCLRDGDEKDWDGYAGNWYLTSAAKRAPQVVDVDGSQINNPDKVYGGCMVNVVVRLWPQANADGKRVNGALEIVQFVADGDRFGGGGKPAASDWVEDSSQASVVDEDEI